MKVVFSISTACLLAAAATARSQTSTIVRVEEMQPVRTVSAQRTTAKPSPRQRPEIDEIYRSAARPRATASGTLYVTPEQEQAFQAEARALELARMPQSQLKPVTVPVSKTPAPKTTAKTTAKAPTAPKKTEPAKKIEAVKKPTPTVAKPKAPEPLPPIAGGPGTQQTTPSLFQSQTAKKLDITKLSLFGPQASSFRYDSRMVRAAEIAAARAWGRSQGSCWRYVKNALLAAGLVDSRPTSAYAKEAAYELTTKYGFRKIACSDPFKAPLGSVLVYGGKGAGHVEFRTKSGFVSDFTTPKPSKRPLIGVYVK